MSILDWILVGVDAAIIAAIAVLRWRRAGRAIKAISANEPAPDEVEALKSVLTKIYPDKRTAPMDALAYAALVWMREQRYIR